MALATAHRPSVRRDAAVAKQELSPHGESFAWRTGHARPHRGMLCGIRADVVSLAIPGAIEAILLRVSRLI